MYRVSIDTSPPITTVEMIRETPYYIFVKSPFDPRGFRMAKYMTSRFFSNYKVAKKYLIEGRKRRVARAKLLLQDAKNMLIAARML